MILRWLIAALHLLALGIGLGAVLDRAWTLRGPLDKAALRRVFRADTLWGIAALLWVTTGLWRAFGGLEKGTGYYLNNHVFWTKMALFVLIVILEFRAAATLTRWRRQAAQGIEVDTRQAPLLARISRIEVALLVLMVLAATAMARGIGS